jgi:hypothetical protein
MNGWHIVPLALSLGTHAQEWDWLNEHAFDHHPMLTSTFIDGLLENFGSGSEHLCRYVEDGQVRAMCLVAPRNKFLWSSFLPSQGQIGATLIPDAALIPSLLPSLPWHVMQLDLLCNDPGLGEVLASSESHRRNHAFTMSISLLGTFEQYWGTRSARLQSNLRRYEKRLVAEGIVQRHVRTTAPEEMAAAVARYACLEGAGWKGAEGSALGSSAAQHTFYVDTMTRFAASGHASVHELWFDDELAASRLIVTRGDTHVMLKTTYAEKFAPYAPGRLLLRTVIEDIFTKGPNGKIEFCTDAPPDLLGWATDQRWVQHASLYRSPVARRLISGVHVLRKRSAAPDHPAVNDRRLKAETFSHPDCLPADVKKFIDRGEKIDGESGISRYRNLVDTIHAGDKRIFFYTLRRSDKVVAVLPLRAEKAMLGWYLQSLGDADTSLYEPVFEPGLKPAELSFLITAIQRDFDGLASFKLAPMDPDSIAYQTLLDAFQIIGWVPFEHARFCVSYQASLSNVELSPPAGHAGVCEMNCQREDLADINTGLDQQRMQSEIIVHNSGSLRGMARMAVESIRRLVRLRNAGPTQKMDETAYLAARNTALR